MKIDRLFLVILVSAFCRSVNAEVSGASFLQTGVGARALGMGEAFNVLADDVTSIYWNPAGLIQLNRSELYVERSQLLAGADVNNLAFDRPMSFGSLGFAITSISYPRVEGRDENGQRNGSFDSRDTALTLSLARRAFATTNYGINAKLIQQSIAGEHATGIAADFGLQNRGDVLSSGISVHNLGPRMKFSQQSYALPLDVTVGLGALVFSGLRLETDVKRLVYDRKTSLQLGMEYSLGNRISLRSGYLVRTLGSNGRNNITGNSAQSDFFSGINLGIGINVLNLTLDYAAVPSSDEGQLHHFSLTSRF